MEALDELRRLVPPPPAGEREPVRWERAEEELGLALPADYKALIDEYGAGSFDDFLWVFEPYHDNQFLDLLWQTPNHLRVLRTLVEDGGGEEPYLLRSEPGGLVSWGLTDNGDMCFWHVTSRDPSEWTVALRPSRSSQWHRFEGALTEFLVEMLSGRERVSIFPEGVPSSAPGFTPAPTSAT